MKAQKTSGNNFVVTQMSVSDLGDILRIASATSYAVSNALSQLTDATIKCEVTIDTPHGWTSPINLAEKIINDTVFKEDISYIFKTPSLPIVNNKTPVQIVSIYESLKSVYDSFRGVGYKHIPLINLLGEDFCLYDTAKNGSLNEYGIKKLLENQVDFKTTL